MDESIQAKSLEIQRSLTRWAKKHLTLKPGERLVFSLRVEDRATVDPKKLSQEYLKMSPVSFFSESRLMACGGRQSLSTMVHSSIYGVSEQKGKIPTLANFLERYPRSVEMGDISGLGQGGVNLAIKCLESVGIKLVE